MLKEIITTSSIFLLLFLSGSSLSAKSPANNHNKKVKTTQANIIKHEDQNPHIFTQGIYKENNTFYISSGLYRKSFLLRETHSLATKRQYLQKQYFAEGLTVIDQTLYLLSWKEGTLFLFNKETLELTKTIAYGGEGWGLSHIPKKENTPPVFIMSDGSDTLFFRAINNFEIKRTLKIEGLDLINELEYVNGIIWANRWYDNHIYGIDFRDGCIVAKVDLLPLRRKATTINNKNVVNGIAYDKHHQGLWVTGKLWSKRFLIEIPNLQKDHCNS